MCALLLTSETAEQYRGRVQSLTADAERKWGTMKPVDMLAHLRRAGEISLGEFETKDKSIPIVRNIMGFVVFRIIPWPKGRVKTDPDFLPTDTAEFAEEQEKVLSLIGKFTEALAKDPDRKSLHTILGPIPMTFWSVVHGKHFDHHLRQFGV